MDLIKEHSFTPGTATGGVTIIRQMPGAGGWMVTFGHKHGSTPDSLSLDVYHDIVGNGFTSWPCAKTLNRETLLSITVAFDHWLENVPASQVSAELFRNFVKCRDLYRDQLRAM
jgi:hypothetical protein